MIRVYWYSHFGRQFGSVCKMFISTLEFDEEIPF